MIRVKVSCQKKKMFHLLLIPKKLSFLDARPLHNNLIIILGTYQKQKSKKKK